MIVYNRNRLLSERVQQGQQGLEHFTGSVRAASHKYLRFHPGVLHLVDEGIRHVYGHVLLLGICSVT